MRDISWSATSRHGKLISKVYQVERSSVSIPDRRRWPSDAGKISASGDSAGRYHARRPRLTCAGTGADDGSGNAPVCIGWARAERIPPQCNLPSFDYAVNAALSLARVAMHSGDTAGLRCLWTKAPGVYAGGAGRGAICVKLWSSWPWFPVSRSRPHHSLAAESLLVRHRRRSLVVWITDLAETAATPEVIDAASRLLHKHVVLFAVVGEPELRAAGNASAGIRLRKMYQYVRRRRLFSARSLVEPPATEQGALAMELSPAACPQKSSIATCRSNRRGYSSRIFQNTASRAFLPHWVR